MDEKNIVVGDTETPPEVSKEPDGGFKNYFRIFTYADKLDRCLFALAFLAAIGSGLALPLEALVFGGSVTRYNDYSGGSTSATQFTGEINNYLLWFIYIFAAKFILTYISTTCISIAATRTVRSLRQAFLEHRLRQEIWHFDKHDSGAIASQATVNGNKIYQGIAEKLTLLVSGLSTFLSAFIVALSVQPILALIAMSVVPAIFVALSVCIYFDAPIESKITTLYSRAGELAQETISSIRTVKAFWAQDKMAEKYDVYLQQAHQIGKKKSPIYGVFFSTEYFCVYSAIALSFWQGYRMFQRGEISSAGTVITVVLTVTMASTSISSIAPQFQSFTGAAAAAAELFSVLDKKSLLDPLDPSGKQPDVCQGNIKIQNLTFAYPSRPTAPVLRDFSISIPAGKKTALVGASGCGKSTLVGLLEKWYEATSGKIELDGIELADYNTKWLRSRIRLVQQEPVLFRGSVFQNVARGFIDTQIGHSHTKQMDLVREACKAANADDFISRLPNGYDTEVGERAGMLSGGQRQRIAIARSIISNPKVLLLDEATSALDPKAERLVQDALDRVSISRTTLIIAHKLATVRNCDNIVVMSEGMMVEQGTHNELMAKEGYYAALVAAQDLGHENDVHDEKQEETNTLDNELDKVHSMRRTSTNPQAVQKQKDKTQNLSVGTLNYSLLRCIIVMFIEQKSLYPCFLISGVACLVGGATFPAQALLFSRLLNIFVLEGQAATDEANFYSLMFFVVALGNLAAYFTIGITCNIIGQTVTHRYRLEMFRRVLSQDVDFFDRPENASGALTSNLSVLPTQLQELISANILLIFIVLVNIVSSSILALAYGWKLGLVIIFGGLPFLIGSGYVRIRLEVGIEASNAERYAESASLVTEAITSIKTVASLTFEKQIMEEYSKLLAGISRRSFRSLAWTMLWYSLSQSLDFLVMTLGFWYGAKLLAAGEYTTSQFYIIFIGLLFAGQAAAQFFGYTTSLTKAVGAANYILWLRTLKPIMVETKDNKDVGPQRDDPIDMQDIGFRYPQRDSMRVLRGITMTIEPGQYVAYVGPSGCGKSTLISLLERFYDPTSGRISIKDLDISKMSPRLYRNHMSLVAQEPTLYQGSVRENIALGFETDPSDDQINEACRMSNSYDFIQSLPEGLNTPCGSRGLQFSGGQRQRIAIARALIRKPRLLLLDEATSALDTQSERLVQKTLDEAAASRTTIAVAHRLSTVRHADVIYVLEDGKVVESGTHAELQRIRGRYYEMCLAQSLDQA